MSTIPTLLAAAAIAAALGNSPSAQADPVDYEVAAYAITAADSICQSISNNPTTAGVTAVDDNIKSASGLSNYRRGEVLGLSVRSKCPQNLGILQQWTNEVCQPKNPPTCDRDY